jgi:hypothetical protein
MAGAEPLGFALDIGRERGEVRLSLSLEALAQPVALGEPSPPIAAIPSPWTVDGDIDWEAVEALRLLGVVFDDGRRLALVAVRPRGTSGHDADEVTSLLVEEEDLVPVEEALLSTEYDAEGLPRRVGLELWIDPEAPPLRVAGYRARPAAVDAGELRRQATPMSFRVDGVDGEGAYEVLQPA